MVRRLVIVSMILVAALVPSAAFSADVEGKIQSVNAADRTITLDNGTTIWLADSVQVEAMKQGADVKVSYEEKDGKPVASSVEVK
jgi:hypothetical protein